MKQHSIAASVATAGILPLMLAPLARLDFLYYGVLLFLPLLRLHRAGSASVLLLLGLICAGIGILLNNPLPVFRPWERLGMFALLLGGIGPLFGGKYNEDLSRQLFQNLAVGCLIIGGLSAAGAGIGLNLGTGQFSGLTPHSMILGPIAAIGFLYAIHRTMERYAESGKVSVLLSLAAVACLISLLLAASRSALLATVVGATYLILHLPRGRGLMLLMVGLGCLLLLPFSGELLEGILHKMNSAREAGSIFSSRAELWEDRWQEFAENPLIGVGFASQRIITFDHSLQSGSIEPGSSYLGCLSMLGVIGTLPLLAVLVHALRRGMQPRYFPPLAACVLIFFCIHMLFEGYLISAGSILCVLLWSCISAALPTHT